VTYRTPDPAAELAALRAEVAALRAKPATRLVVEHYNDGSRDWTLPAAATMFLLNAAGIGWAAHFVVYGWRADVQRGAAVLAALLLVWALAFVRRVPAEGARS